MRNIFIGMILVFINFTITINMMQIGLVPNFIGYMFMFKGVSELIPLSDRFSKVKPMSAAMIVYSAFCYALDLFGISVSIGQLFAFIIGLVSTVMSLIISYNIVIGIKEIELKQERNLNAKKLLTTWKLLAIFSLVSYWLLIIPALFIVSVIIGFVIAVYYLFVFNESKNLFYQQNI